MVDPKFVLFAFLALTILLSGAEAREIIWPGNKANPMCCTNQLQFGVCDSKEDDQRCEQFCLNGCTLNKGGGCQPTHTGTVCQCYCSH
ncbi:hypothetical protein AALP_AA8G174600 [Arabis alpina]|uniref:Knottin scorpion toxin-like domain-containing protein n=1 Tax=Arabis alpina TaxID=50452 RepID=A0A087G7N0_ARAAL|nr:hypothetical protein AALP_AA8G174600 [Arabis alpina]